MIVIFTKEEMVTSYLNWHILETLRLAELALVHESGNTFKILKSREGQNGDRYITGLNIKENKK